MAANIQQRYAISGNEILKELESDYILMQTIVQQYYNKTPNKPSNALIKIVRLMEATYDEAFEETVSYVDGQCTQTTRIITYDGCEIFSVDFTNCYERGKSVYHECRSGFDDLYYRPTMPGFEESKRHFEEISTEVALQKLSLNG